MNTRITLIITLMLAGMLSPALSQMKNLQYWRPNDQRGLNIFESSKQDTVPWNGVSVRIGGANTLQFQALEASTASEVGIFELGSNFNLATSNLDLDVQLYPGLRMHLRTYLSSRHHPEPYVKGGYMQVDRLDFIRPGFMSALMDNVTIKVGHMQINYGDNHFRRTDNGQAIYNPFVGNYILDSFTTEVGGEVYFQSSGFLAMLGLTNGKLNQSTVLPVEDAPQTKASVVAKVGFDDQVSKDLRFRITGSVYHTGETGRNYLYSGDRAGSRYYNILTDNTKEFRTPRFDPGFVNEITAIMLNTFVKFQGLEFYGVFENASGKAVAETETRSFNQYGAELIYRIGARENFYLGGRYNLVTGKVNTGEEVDINRINIGGGWFLTKNVMAKAEYVTQSYNGFPAESVYNEGAFNGFVLEAIISF
jgi:hypothetical protein